MNSDPRLGRMPTEEEISRRLRELAPFHHVVDLPYGLSTYDPELAHVGAIETRKATFMRHAWSSINEAAGGSLYGLRVLDIGCNCGGLSFEALRSGASHVLGIDVVDHYLDQGRFIAEALGEKRVEFRNTDIEDLDPDAVGEFDMTLCLGILYHLENPVLAMRRAASVTARVLVVDTNLLNIGRGGLLSRKAVWLMNAPLPPLNGDVTTSLWRTGHTVQFRPTAAGVTLLLRMIGFDRVRHLKPKGKGLDSRYKYGSRGTFIATRSPAN
jgi:SAM-dependent methyltransferase